MSILSFVSKLTYKTVVVAVRAWTGADGCTAGKPTVRNFEIAGTPFKLSWHTKPCVKRR